METLLIFPTWKLKQLKVCLSAIVREIPRFGKRKPIENKENPQKIVTGEMQNSNGSKNLPFNENNPKTYQNDAPNKAKLSEAQSNPMTMSLPQSSNIKNYGIGLIRQTVINKDKEVPSEEKKDIKKKRVDRITTAFLLGYNQIRDITGISPSIDIVMFDAFNRLQWLDLQHNYLTSISEELNEFKNLKTLYLHANFIPSIKEFTNLKELTQLRNLTVHGNPLVRIPNFRLYFIIIFLILKNWTLF